MIRVRFPVRGDGPMGLTRRTTIAAALITFAGCAARSSTPLEVLDRIGERAIAGDSLFVMSHLSDPFLKALHVDAERAGSEEFREGICNEFRKTRGISWNQGVNADRATVKTYCWQGAFFGPELAVIDIE